MDRAVPAVIVGLVLAGLLALLWRSWRAKTRRDAGLPAGYEVPGDRAEVLASAGVLYVATTPRELPLERLAIAGLAFRARATLTVTATGLILEPDGETGVHIPSSTIELVADATWTIDRVVEPGGLFLVGWRLDRSDPTVGESVDSYFRIQDPTDRRRITDAIHSIAPGAFSPATESEA